MELGCPECESARISELALTCADRCQFREALLELLERLIGFDGATLYGCRGGVGEDVCTRGYEQPPLLHELPHCVAKLESHETLVATRSRPMVDVDEPSSKRHDRLSLYRCFIEPDETTVFASSMWRMGAAVSGLFLARTGRGARFRGAEIRLLEQFLPTIRLADAFVARLQHGDEDASFETWADRVGLTFKERTVAALAVRGLKNPEIAVTLGVSPNTVRNQLAAAFRKADVSTRAELAFVASAIEPLEHQRPSGRSG